MRIAMIIRRLNVKGGTQRQALMLALALKHQKHKIDIYTLELDREHCYYDLLKPFNIVSPSKAELKIANIIKFPWNYISPIAQFMRESRQAKLLSKIIKDNYDILNPHDQVSYRVAYYYKQLKKNIPSVWNMNDLPLKLWGYDRIRGCVDNFHQPWYRVLVYKLFDWYDNVKFISKQDSIVVVDFFNRDLVKRYLGLKAHTVRSGPDFEHFVYKQKNPPQHNKITVLTSGILMPHRRYEDAILGTRILRNRGLDAELTIMGDYDNDRKYYEKLTSLVREHGLEKNVHFTGRVSEQDLINSYHNHDVYTFQHHLQSDGLSPFEAAACGMPLVVSKTAGCHEVLTHGENALLIDPKDPQDWAEKVSELAKNKELFAKMARSANSFVRANFSWKKYANNWLAVATQIDHSQKLKSEKFLRKS